jgi:rhomboid protease GluP
MSNFASEQASVSGATLTGPSTAGPAAAPSESPGPSAAVTYTLIGLNVLVFIVMVISGVSFLSPTTESLLKWGADYGPLTLRGQWWRMFTSMFVHIGVMHVLFNMVVLANIGPFMEVLLGGSGYTILYVAAGLGGDAASLALHPGTVSAGASGAIFGLYGGLLAFLVLHKSSIAKEVLFPLWKGAAVFVGYNLLYSLKPGVDMAAHAGGLAAGFVIGLFLVQPASEIAPARGTRNGVAALLGLAVLIVPLVALPKPDDLIAEVNRMSAVEDKAVDVFNNSLNK